jgi:hypothetical protein
MTTALLMSGTVFFATVTFTSVTDLSPLEGDTVHHSESEDARHDALVENLRVYDSSYSPRAILSSFTYFKVIEDGSTNVIIRSQPVKDDIIITDNNILNSLFITPPS